MSKNCAAFRYPGGKLRLGKKILEFFPEWLKHRQFNYSEPFVGGGGMLINVAKTYPHALLNINDLNEEIYSFWKVICDPDISNFNAVKELLREPATISLFNVLKSEVPVGIVDKAYYAVFFNKTTFSGIRTAGPIGGADQSGKWKIDCYYKPHLLLKRLDNLRELLVGRTKVYNQPFQKFMVDAPYDFMYLDPPYFKRGKDLYPTHMSIDEHIELSKMLNARNNWVLSYDKTPEIDELYGWAIRSPISMTKHINVGKRDTCEEIKEYVIIP